MILFQVTITLLVSCLALIAFFSNDWLQVKQYNTVVKFGLKDATIDIRATTTGVTNWCEDIDQFTGIIPSVDGTTYCPIIKDQIEPSIILGIVFVCVGCVLSIVTKSIEDSNFLKRSSLIAAYISSLICFSIALGRWHVIEANICGDDDGETCYNSTDYWLLVGALIGSLTLSLQHILHFLDKVFSIPFGKAHTTSVPSADRKAHPVDPSSTLKLMQVNERV